MLSTLADNYTILQEHSVQKTKYVLSHDKVHVNKTKVMITLKGFFKTCCLKNGQESLLQVGLFSQPSGVLLIKLLLAFVHPGMIFTVIYIQAYTIFFLTLLC